jgi:cytochrome b6-f complex iron-sulfur subunit
MPMSTAINKTGQRRPDNDRRSGSDRRSFLVKTGQGVGILACWAFLLPVARFLGFNAPAKPKLIEVNRVLKPGGFIIETDFIVFDTETGPVAVSRKCTHLGCKLNYHELESKLICPCHKSMFGKDGKRLAGPAIRDLTVFKVTEVGDKETTGYIVTIL